MLVPVKALTKRPTAAERALIKSAFQSDGIYSDAGVLSPGLSRTGGLWAWCRVEGGRVVASGSGILVVKGVAPPSGAESLCEEMACDQATVEINLMELYACLKGIEAWREVHPFEKSVHVLTDSDNTVGRLTRGWEWNGVPTYIWGRTKNLLDVLNISATLLSGHPTISGGHFETGIGPRGYPCSEHNVWCDKECDRLRKIWKKAL